MSASAPAVTALPFNECKVIHFIRHAEGEHNVAERAQPKGPLRDAVYTDPQYFDAVLSSDGVKQCEQLQGLMSTSKLLPELVVASPLRRTLRTATLGLAMCKSATWIAHEDAREHCPYGANPCDKRRSAEEQAKEFETVDFSLVPVGPDQFLEVTETKEALDARCRRLLEFLAARPEQVIAVVSHCAFLGRLFEAHFSWSGSPWFKNVECRTVVLRLKSQD
jgi:broad specificity phosphatase PhoE